MTTTDPGTMPEPHELTVEESHRLFEERARHETGMSGPAFIRAWDAGKLDVNDDAVLGVAMLLPYGRAHA